MKVIAAAILLVVLAAHGAAAADDSTDTSLLLTNVELSAEPMDTSAPDLLTFGVISLGVIGLFWIRRHTSEL